MDCAFLIFTEGSRLKGKLREMNDWWDHQLSKHDNKENKQSENARYLE